MTAASSRPSHAATTAAVLGTVAAATAAGLLWTIHRRRRATTGRRSSGDDESDTISVEGSVMVTLPPWAIASSPDYHSRTYRTDEEMMSLAVHLSDRNVTEGTGGPFGAAVFERHADGNCTLVSVGVNRVVPLGNSCLHGETVAIQLAQRRVGSFTLQMDAEGGDGGKEVGLFYDEVADEKEEKTEDGVCKPVTPGGKKRRFELFTSCEPCAMCLGATLWSGASRIVCGATKADAQAIGFDEGPVFEASYKHLEEHGVEVTRGVLTEEAAAVLQRYGSSGLIYNR